MMCVARSIPEDVVIWGMCCDELHRNLTKTNLVSPLCRIFSFNLPDEEDVNLLVLLTTSLKYGSSVRFPHNTL